MQHLTEPTSNQPASGPLAAIRSYGARLRLFSRNARLYLLYVITNGVVYGIYRLLFNFYVLSLGYDEALLGRLLTVTSTCALLSALPAGYISDRVGRKGALLLAGAIITVAMAGVVLWPAALGLYLMSALLGVGQSLAAVTSGPFLMENSGDEERTYLFSFSFGVQMIAGFVGNWLGGQLPGWLGGAAGVSATSTLAYTLALTAVVAGAAAALIPILFVRTPKLPAGEREAMLSPFQYARRHPRLLLKLILPLLVTSLGAGMLMPFRNVFYRNNYLRSDADIGLLFAFGSLFMGLGLLMAPPLADRYGKMRLVVVTQALSIPFLALMGFSPWFLLSALAYLIRLALMNMSNPIYQTFVMERVESEARGTVASMVSMSWNFGWALSPMISGWLQVNYGFAPVFLLTMLSYAIAIFLYWRFFWDEPAPATI